MRHCLTPGAPGGVCRIPLGPSEELLVNFFLVRDFGYFSKK